MISAGIEACNLPDDLSLAFEDKDVSLKRLKECIDEAVQKSLTSGKRGVIIFVDDLDRLNPPVAVEILELLKNIFSIKHCIFILAIDYEVVVKGLEPKFGSSPVKRGVSLLLRQNHTSLTFSYQINSYPADEFYGLSSTMAISLE